MPAPFTPSPIRYRVWDGERMHMPGPASYSASGFALASNGRGIELSGDEWHVDGSLVALLSTGLRDADGVEVFEGDIVETIGKTTSTPLLVESAGPGRGFLLRLVVNDKRSTRHPNEFLIDWLPGYRVTGHVYQPPGGNTSPDPA